ERATGMFALALWDRERQQISLVRDRAGEKPLYYGRVGSVFVVASEARTFGTIAGSAPEIDRRSVGLMMRFGAIPAPYSIYQGISKLEPGHRVTIGIDTAARGDLPASQPYWQASVLAREYASRQLSFGSAREATDALHECLGAAVRRQLISDVPLGAFLSG